MILSMIWKHSNQRKRESYTNKTVQETGSLIGYRQICDLADTDKETREKQVYGLGQYWGVGNAVIDCLRVQGYP